MCLRACLRAFVCLCVWTCVCVFVCLSMGMNALIVTHEVHVHASIIARACICTTSTCDCIGCSDVHACVYLCACIRTGVCVCACTRACMCVCARVCVCVCVCMCQLELCYPSFLIHICQQGFSNTPLAHFSCMWEHACTCTQTRIHTRTHLSTHVGAN